LLGKKYGRRLYQPPEALLNVSPEALDSILPEVLPSILPEALDSASSVSRK